MSNIVKIQISAFKKKLDRMIERIAKDRDDLRNLIDEYRSVLGDCDTAIDDLKRVADDLSKYV